jgi:hypothetical protein
MVMRENTFICERCENETSWEDESRFSPNDGESLICPACFDELETMDFNSFLKY